MFKRIVNWILIILLVFVSAGCSKKENDSINTQEEETETKDDTPKEKEHDLTTVNYLQYVKSIKCEMTGQAAFYIYLKFTIELKEGYKIKDTINVRVRFTGDFDAVLKSDYATPVDFERSEYLNLKFYSFTTEKTSSASLYDLDNKNYAFVDMISHDFSVLSISGKVVSEK